MNSLHVRLKITICWVFVFVSFVYAQKPTSSNSNITFQDFLSGVRFASVLFEDDAQKEIDDNKFPGFVNTLRKYLLGIGFEYIAITSKEKDYLMESASSYCNICFINFYYQSGGGEMSNIGISFTGCNGSNFTFKSENTIEDDNEEFYDELRDIYSTQKKKFNKQKRLKMESEMSEWNEVKLKNRFIISADEIEGIYEDIKFSSEDKGAKYKIGIIKNKDGGYDVIYLDGALNYDDWIEGEVKAKISMTSKSNFYTVKWLMAPKILDDNVYAYLDENDFLTFEFTTAESKQEQEKKLLKLFPTNNIDSDISGDYISSGSGIIVSRDGFVITCEHVVRNANSVSIEVNSNLSSTVYNAEVVLKDEDNDLAILKIKDKEFSSFNPISFSFSSNTCSVGEEIFALGFPLINSMGNELKVTNGIISAKTGFKNSLNQYTISVPVQPGNSGGPLFDYSGNLVGIINAKYAGAENVSYAVKISYLVALIDLLGGSFNIPETNSIPKSDLPQMVNMLRDYVVLIKVK